MVQMLKSNFFIFIFFKKINRGVCMKKEECIKAERKK